MCCEGKQDCSLEDGTAAADCAKQPLHRERKILKLWLANKADLLAGVHFALACRTMKHMQKRLRDNELRILRGEQEVDESQVDNDSADASPLSSEASFVQRARQPAAAFVSHSQPSQPQPTDKGLSTRLSCRRAACGAATNEAEAFTADMARASRLSELSFCNVH